MNSRRWKHVYMNARQRDRAWQGLLIEVNVMKYSEQFKQAEKSGKIEEMTYQAFEFGAVGDTLVGELVDYQPTQFAGNEKTVNKYIIKTDDGLKSVILGAIGDGQLEGRVKPGDILQFRYEGKKDLPGGRHANIFIIKRIQKEVNNGEEKVNPSTDD